MKNNIWNKPVLLCALVFFIAGCATWAKVGGPYLNNSEMYSADLPWGWMKYKGKDLIITRDGVFLEDIIIKRVNVKEKLEHTKKRFIKGMLSEEIAEIEMDDIIADSDVCNFELAENIPVIISGQNGFKLVYSFCNKEGLKYKCIHYGFGYGDWVYSLFYTACSAYYFDKNLKDFDSVIQSFKFFPSADKKTSMPLPVVEANPEISSYAQYYRFLHKTISSAIVKPAGSVPGSISAAFTLSNEGELEGVQILESSSEDAALRVAVIEAIKKSAPFPSFPNDIKAENKKTFTITIEFKYNKG